MSFVKLDKLVIKGNRWLGSTIRIEAIFNTAPDSVTITIEDPTASDTVDRVAMIQETGANRVWTYTFQSSESDNSGTYEIYIRATKGSNTSFEIGKFELADADDD